MPLGGVINIVTYSPVYDHNNAGSISLGTQDTRSADATATVKLADMSGIKLSAGGINMDKFDTDHNPVDQQFNDPKNRYAVEKSTIQVIPGLQADTELTYGESRSNPAQVAFETDTEKASSYSARGGLSWQSPIGLITNNNYINHADSHATGNEFDSVSTTELFVSQLEDQFKVNADNIGRIALEYRHKYYTGADAGQVFPQSPSIDQSVYAASGAWLAQLDKQWSWTNALRIDHQDSAQTGTLFTDSVEKNSDYSHITNSWSGNSGLVYKATDIDTFRATYGRGVQIPGLIPEGLTDTIQLAANTFYDVEGNPYIKPTIVRNYELAYDRIVANIFSTAKFSLYYEKDQDIIGFDSSTFTRVAGPNTYIVIQSANVGSSQGLGTELELKGSHNNFRWDGSYSYARVLDTSGVAQYVGYEGSTPQHHLRLLGGYTTGAWEFDANGQYLTSTHMLRVIAPSTFTSLSSGGYTSLGARIGYKLTDNFTLALSGSNLAQATTTESPYPAIERQLFLTLTGHF